jgi:hypothetical protein
VPFNPELCTQPRKGADIEYFSPQTGWKPILHCSLECRTMVRVHLKAPSRTHPRRGGGVCRIGFQPVRDEILDLGALPGSSCLFFEFCINLRFTRAFLRGFKEAKRDAYTLRPDALLTVMCGSLRYSGSSEGVKLSRHRIRYSASGRTIGRSGQPGIGPIAKMGASPELGRQD